MKYIICRDFSGQPIPFIFPDKVAHTDMRDQLPYGAVIAAGYVELRDSGFHCYGGDADLGVSASSDDAQLLADFFSGQ